MASSNREKRDRQPKALPTRHKIEALWDIIMKETEGPGIRSRHHATLKGYGLLQREKSTLETHFLGRQKYLREQGQKRRQTIRVQQAS